MPRLRLRRLLDSIDQLKHLSRSRAAIVDNEIAVHLRDARFSDPRIFQAQFIHQFSRGNAVGILENAACALGDWLCCASFLL